MPLPDVCPLEEESCKQNACHLYHVDWRTGEENCSIGYRITAKTRSSRQPQQDTYAENTRRRLGRDFAPSFPEEIKTEPETEPAQPRAAEEGMSEPVVRIREEVVSVNKDTTVIQSYNEVEDVPEDSGKPERKRIDDAMKLDLPEDYEEEFWN